MIWHNSPTWRPILQRNILKAIVIWHNSHTGKLVLQRNINACLNLCHIDRVYLFSTTDTWSYGVCPFTYRNRTKSHQVWWCQRSYWRGNCHCTFISATAPSCIFEILNVCFEPSVHIQRKYIIRHSILLRNQVSHSMFENHFKNIFKWLGLFGYVFFLSQISSPC